MTAYDDAVLADSPWGYWKCDETSGTTLADSSGNGRGMAISGAPVFSQPGPGGPSIFWPSKSDYGQVACPLGSVITFEAWVNLTAYPATNTAVMGNANGYGSGTGTANFFIDPNGRPCMYTYNGGNLLTYGTALALDQWHHLIGSVGPDGQKVRVDKMQTGYDTRTAFGGAVAYMFLHSGVHANGAAIYLDQSSALTIARPAIYSTQLSDASTDAHYNAMPRNLSGVWGWSQ